MSISIYFMLLSCIIYQVDTMDIQEFEIRKVILKEEALRLLDQNQYVSDNDESLDRDIASYYFVENIGYLITYEFIEDAVLFKSKKHYLEFIEEKPSTFVPDKLDESFVDTDKLIYDLSTFFKIPLSGDDNTEGLKRLDNEILAKGLPNADLVNCKEEIFAYFRKVVMNSLGSKDWKSVYSEDNASFVIIDKKGKEYELYKPLYKMLINQDENFSLYSLANQILKPFKLDIGNREDIPD